MAGQSKPKPRLRRLGDRPDARSFLAASRPPGSWPSGEKARASNRLSTSPFEGLIRSSTRGRIRFEQGHRSGAVTDGQTLPVAAKCKAGGPVRERHDPIQLTGLNLGERPVCSALDCPRMHMTALINQVNPVPAGSELDGADIDRAGVSVPAVAVRRWPAGSPGLRLRP